MIGHDIFDIFPFKGRFISIDKLCIFLFDHFCTLI